MHFGFISSCADCPAKQDNEPMTSISEIVQWVGLILFYTTLNKSVACCKLSVSIFTRFVVQQNKCTAFSYCDIQ